MQRTPSNTQVDRLGDRIRRGAVTDDDLRLLDDYRRSFETPYNTVVDAIREKLQLEPTGRPAKSTGSIGAKLRRESIRLVQVQDIAGCRVIVADRREQDRVVGSLTRIFDGAVIVDRRAMPRHGYRAVHVVVEIAGKAVEIQVRTSLQHSWAEVSEKLSDVFNPEIKYGGGTEEERDLLRSSSDLVAEFEEMESQIQKLTDHPNVRAAFEEQVPELQRRAVAQRRAIADSLNMIITAVERDARKQEKP